MLIQRASKFWPPHFKLVKETLKFDEWSGHEDVDCFDYALFQNVPRRASWISQILIGSAPVDNPNECASHYDLSKKLATRLKDSASLNDYWQFSHGWFPIPEHETPAQKARRTKNCSRSGLNLTKAEFRRLGKEISQWMRAKQPEAFGRVVAAMALNASQVSNNLNLYQELSNHLISNRGLDPYANGSFAIPISDNTNSTLTRTSVKRRWDENPIAIASV